MMEYDDDPGISIWSVIQIEIKNGFYALSVLWRSFIAVSLSRFLI
jgi:hypothetical protein